MCVGGGGGWGGGWRRGVQKLTIYHKNSLILQYSQDADRMSNSADPDQTTPESIQILRSVSVIGIGKVFRSLIAVGAVGVRVPLYLGHS